MSELFAAVASFLGCAPGHLWGILVVAVFSSVFALFDYRDKGWWCILEGVRWFFVGAIFASGGLMFLHYLETSTANALLGYLLCGVAVLLAFVHRAKPAVLDDADNRKV